MKNQDDLSFQKITNPTVITPSKNEWDEMSDTRYKRTIIN